MPTPITATYSGTPWRVDITDGMHRWSADEPQQVGGGDTAPDPIDLVCGALAACTAVTVQMYAARKQWPLAGIEVTVTRNPDGAPADGANELKRVVTLHGALDAEQRQRLLDIANKCPTHKLLAGEIRIPTELSPLPAQRGAGQG